MAVCPLCSSAESVPNGWTTSRLEFHRCVQCGFIFIPRPISFPVQDLYNAVYVQERGHDLFGSAIHRSKLKTAEWYLRRVTKYIPLGTMIDIGCSTGANVAQAAAMGWKTSGMDINEAALSSARTLVPEAEFYSSLAAPEMKEGSFSLATLFDVIEHIEDLHPFMRRVRSLLKAGGVVFILTPDAHSLSAGVLKSRWPHLFPEHISLFSRNNLIWFLKQQQFQILEAGFAWKFVSFPGLYRHAQCHCGGMLGASLKAFLFPLKASTAVIPFNIGEFYVIARKT